MTDPKACIICGCKDFSEYGSAIDHLVSEEEFLLLKCTHCGFVFTAAPPEEDDINEYYLSEDYISHADRKKSITEVIYHLVRRRMLRKKCRIVTEASGRKTGTILDLGSGTGYFASFMQSETGKPPESR